jgi:outer membrane protein TolC
VSRSLLLAAALAACTPSLSEVRRPVDEDLARRLGAPLDPRTTVDVTALLAVPLDQTAAVKIALANNARLAAAFDELGIAGGGLGAALGLGPLEVDGALRFGTHTERELDVVQNVLGLITGGKRRAAAHADLTAAQAVASAAALRLVARVEIAFADLLGAQQALELRRTAFDAADAAATIRERMYAAGNTTELAQARDRDAREQARLDVGRAETQLETRREVLNALLGLGGAQTSWTATGALAPLPAAPPQLDALETTAVVASLELTAGRARVTGATNLAGEQRLRTVLPELGLGVSLRDDADRGHAIGPMIRLGIPLFDWRGGERLRANAQVSRAEHELTATAIELRAAARAARVTALAAFQEARHLETVVLPLRQQIVDETLKHYNAMDADPFALLLARRELVDAGAQHLDALRRYWTAMAEVTALERGVALHDEP